jgi:hypothetical protein
MAAITNETIGPVYRGSDVTLNFTESPVVDITGWTMSFRLKQSQADPTTLLTVNASITSAPAGTFSVALTAAQTLTLAAGTYQWDVWRTDTGSANALATGTLIVTGSVKIP